MPARRSSSSSALPSWAADDSLVIGTAGADSTDRMAIDTTRKLSPAAVKAVLENAAGGDPADVAFLHLIMRRTWPRLRGELEKVRDAAGEADWQTTPFTLPDGSVPPAAEERQRVVDAALFNMRPAAGTLERGMGTAVQDMAEGCFYAPSAYELLWHMDDPGSGVQACVRAVRPVHPHYMRWSAAPGAPDALLFQRGGRRAGGTVEPWPANQFAVQMTGGRDHPALGAVLDTLVVWWLAATYGPQWLMQFAERFGIPFIYANYPAGSAADRNAVAAALRNLSGKSWGAFPSGTTLQAVDAGKSAGELPQVALIEMADRICTEVIAGGSLTTETAGHGSQALGKVHEGQGNRRHSAILRSVCEVFNAQVIPAILRLNFGDDKFQPSLTHGGEQREDLNATADLLAKAKGLGLAVPAAYAYEVLGIPMPGDDEATLDGPASAAEEDDEEDPAEEPAPGPEAAAAQAAAAALPEAFAADMTAVLAQALTFAAARGAESAGLAQREADAAPAPKKRRATRNPNTPASA